MTKYKKKPVVIEAEQWYPDRQVDGVVLVSEIEDERWRRDAINMLQVLMPEYSPGAIGYIRTLEGFHFVNSADWIITGIQGEKYPIKPDVFEATYELVK